MQFALTGQTHTPLLTHIHPCVLTNTQHTHIHFHILTHTLLHSLTHTRSLTLAYLSHSRTHTFSHTYLHTFTNSNGLPWLQPNLSSVLPGTAPECWSEDTPAQGFLDSIRPIIPCPLSGPPLNDKPFPGKIWEPPFLSHPTHIHSYTCSILAESVFHLVPLAVKMSSYSGP